MVAGLARRAAARRRRAAPARRRPPRCPGPPRTSRRSTRPSRRSAQIEAHPDPGGAADLHPRRQVQHGRAGPSERADARCSRSAPTWSTPVPRSTSTSGSWRTTPSQAYVYGTPETGFASYFSSSATLNQARNQYTDQIVGNLTKDETSLAALRDAPADRGGAAADGGRAGPVGGGAGQVAGAGQRARGGGHEGDPEPGAGSAGPGGGAGRSRGGPAGSRGSRGGAATRRNSNRRRQRPRRRPPWPGTVGGSSSGAAATDAANQAGGTTGPVGGSVVGQLGAGMAAVQAAVSQLGVPYVFGGEEAGVGFDCSGLVQWAWAPGGRHHPEDDRDAVAGPDARVARRPRNPVTCSSITTSTVTTRSTTSSCTPARGPTGPTP